MAISLFEIFNFGNRPSSTHTVGPIIGGALFRARFARGRLAAASMPKQVENAAKIGMKRHSRLT